MKGRDSVYVHYERSEEACVAETAEDEERGAVFDSISGTSRLHECNITNGSGVLCRSARSCEVMIELQRTATQAAISIGVVSLASCDDIFAANTPTTAAWMIWVKK